ncbi:hypothetical protein ACFZC5_19170 [Nocardia gamkensis]|uniref:hypothetical protein n=1 Tax=Nocardia gamkensis TaxID=352869 RepID=UPI0036EAB1B5
MEDKFRNVAIAAGVARPELLFGRREWLSWLEARHYAEQHLGDELSVEFILKLHELLGRRTAPESAGKFGYSKNRNWGWLRWPASEYQRAAISANRLLTYVPGPFESGPYGVVFYPADEGKPGARRARVLDAPLTEAEIAAIDDDPLLGYLPAFPTREYGVILYPNFGSPDGTAADVAAMCEWFNAAVSNPDNDPYEVAADLELWSISGHHGKGDYHGRLSRILLNWALEKQGKPASAIPEFDEDLLTMRDDWVDTVKAGSLRYRLLEAQVEQSAGIADPVSLLGLAGARERYRRMGGRSAPFVPGEEHDPLACKRLLATLLSDAPLPETDEQVVAIVDRSLRGGPTGGGDTAPQPDSTPHEPAKPTSSGNRVDPVAIDLGDSDGSNRTTASSSGPSRTTYDTVPLPDSLLEPADDIELVWPEVDSRGWFVLPGTGPDKQPFHTSNPEGDPFLLLANGKFVTVDGLHEDLLGALLAHGVSLDEISGFGWWRVSGRVKGLEAFSRGFEEWNGDPMNPAQVLDALENSGADLGACEFDAQSGSEHQGLMWRGAAAEMPVGQILSHDGDAYKLLSGYSSADDGAGNRVVFWNDLVAWEATAEGQSFTIRVNPARSEPAEFTITVRADGDSVTAHYTAARFGQDRARAAAAWSVVHDKFTSWLAESGASWAIGSETAPTEDISVATTRPATVADSAQRSERIIRAEPEGRHSPNAASEAASWLAGQLDGWPTEQVNLACAELAAMVTDAAEHRRGRVHLVSETTDDRLRVTLLDTHAASMPRNARGGIPTRSGLAVLPGRAVAADGPTPIRSGVELFKRHAHGWRQAVWFELRKPQPDQSPGRAEALQSADETLGAIPDIAQAGWASRQPTPQPRAGAENLSAGSDSRSSPEQGRSAQTNNPPVGNRIDPVAIDLLPAPQPDGPAGDGHRADADALQARLEWFRRNAAGGDVALTRIRNGMGRTHLAHDPTGNQADEIIDAFREYTKFAGPNMPLRAMGRNLTPHQRIELARREVTREEVLAAGVSLGWPEARFREEAGIIAAQINRMDWAFRNALPSTGPVRMIRKLDDLVRVFGRTDNLLGYRSINSGYTSLSLSDDLFADHDVEVIVYADTGSALIAVESVSAMDTAGEGEYREREIIAPRGSTLVLLTEPTAVDGKIRLEAELVTGLHEDAPQQLS